MKGDTEVILMIVMFFLGVLLATVLDEQSLAFILSALVAPAATLAAAYFGARYAYQWQRAQRQEEEVERRVLAVNSAMFDLSRMHNAFLLLKKQLVEEVRDDPHRHLKMRPTVGMRLRPPQFDTKGLAFLFHSKDPNFLGRLAMLETEIVSTISTIDHRSQLHFDVVQPAVESIADPNGLVSGEAIEAAVGPRLTEQIRILTDVVVQSIDKLVDMTLAEGKALWAAANPLVPDRQLIQFSSPAGK